MTLANWVLGVTAVSIWTGVALWYFWRDIQRAWRTRHSKWFRGD